MRKSWSGALLAIVLLVVLGLVASACGSDDDKTSSTGTTAKGSGTDAASILGTPDKATGTPVKVGLITNGAGQGFDQSDDVPIAKAVANWINDYRGGLAGHRIEIATCVDSNDPGKASDCANEMVRQDVVAVVYSSNGMYEASWRPLSQAGIPTFIQAVGAKSAAAEKTNTFNFNNSVASTIDGPLGLAKKAHAKVLSVIAVDVPAATVNYREGPGPKKIKDAGVELQLIAAPLGTPDLTVQAQQVVRKNPDGAVNLLGNDAFCVAALNGLKAAGYKGVISANEQCISDNTIKSVGADYIKGIRVIAQVPLTETKNPSTELYNAVLDKWAPDVDRLNGTFMFLAMTGFDAATRDLKGEVTAKTVTAAAKAMKWTEQPGSGGRHIRCNGKADPNQPAVCSNALLYASLDGAGQAAGSEVIGDTEIPD